MKKHNLLLPHSFMVAGWIIASVGVVTFLLAVIFDIEFSFNDIRVLLGLDKIEVKGMIGLSRLTADSSLVYTISSIGIIIGSYFAGFSRCREEDEFTQYLRYRALTITMFLLLSSSLVVQIFCWGLNFLVVQNIFSAISPLFYMLLFHITLFLKGGDNEEYHQGGACNNRHYPR